MSLKVLIVVLLIIPHFDLLILSHGEIDTNEIISQGRSQYQLLRERGSLPKYGPCWRGAIERVDEGCRDLSEETQSDIALSLTNCFLDMSGIETYVCDMDKKQNVRRICISSMSDRAFNVYTEFYTHTLNMCWFLRGQIWQETMSENTIKVGKQLESSALKQEKLLRAQKESLEVQEKMLKHGKIIEHVLSDLSVATQNHQEMLLVMGQTINSLQSWLVGEVSWINTLIFYISFGIFIIIMTSTPRTIASRLPILVILVLNIAAERIACAVILSNNDFRKNASDLFGDIQNCIQVLRYLLVTVSFAILIYNAYFYEDAVTKSKSLLDNIYKQNTVILEKLDKPNNNLTDTAYLVYKTNFMGSLNSKDRKSPYRKQIEDENLNDRSVETSAEVSSLRRNSVVSCFSSTIQVTPKYNLRSHHNTPKS